MRIFVTGATGVVGKRVIPELVARGHEVTAAARTTEKAVRLKRASATPVVLDLFDRDAVARAVAGHEVVINLATHIPSSSTKMFLPGAWRENDRVRRDGSRILADAAIAGGATRFIQESFAPLYADGGDRWIDEASPVKPARYNRTSLDAEASAHRFTGDGRQGVVLRFGGFYGPDAMQTADFVKFVRKGRFPLFGAPDAYVSSISHDDAAGAVIAALGVPAGLYNATDDEPVTRLEFARVIADALGVPMPKLFPRWVAKLAGSLGELLSRSERISNRKLREASGWTPKYPSVREGFPAAIREMK